MCVISEVSNVSSKSGPWEDVLCQSLTQATPWLTDLLLRTSYKYSENILGSNVGRRPLIIF